MISQHWSRGTEKFYTRETPHSPLVFFLAYFLSDDTLRRSQQNFAVWVAPELLLDGGKSWKSHHRLRSILQIPSAPLPLPAQSLALPFCFLLCCFFFHFCVVSRQDLTPSHTHSCNTREQQRMSDNGDSCSGGHEKRTSLTTFSALTCGEQAGILSSSSHT